MTAHELREIRQRLDQLETAVSELQEREVCP